MGSGVLVLLKFGQFLHEHKETGSSGATESGVWIGYFNVKAWKTTEHKLHKIWHSLKLCKISENEHTPGLDLTQPSRSSMSHPRPAKYFVWTNKTCLGVLEYDIVSFKQSSNSSDQPNFKWSTFMVTRHTLVKPIYGKESFFVDILSSKFITSCNQWLIANLQYLTITNI